MANSGKIAQIIGPVVDVSFAGNDVTLPKILNALIVKKEDGTELILECQQHLGQDTIRAIAMDATEGLTRGLEVIDTGNQIQMPTGEAIKGRLFNVVGKQLMVLVMCQLQMDTISIVNHLDMKICQLQKKYYILVLK